MNWGNLGKTAGAAEGRRGQGGGRGMARMGAAVTAVGLEAAWKDTTLPKEGDMLQCRHFKSCSGCVFDRGFDQTPIMVDSR